MAEPNRVSAQLASPPDSFADAPVQELDSTTEVAPAKGALAELSAISVALRFLSKPGGTADKLEAVTALQAHATALTGGCSRQSWELPMTLAAALGRMFSAWEQDPARINVSTLRTVASAVDVLNAALCSGAEEELRKKVQLRVLVVDDDAVCRRALLMALNTGDLKLSACSSGEEALKTLEREEFDVIFSDIMMPRMNGFTLLKLIREVPQHGQTPVVFVTALSDFETRSKSILSGGCDLMAKPIQPPEVVLKALTLALRRIFARPTPRAAAAAEQPAPRSNTPAKASGPKAPAPTNPAAPPSMLGVLNLDQDFRVKSANQDCLRIFGYAHGELISLSAERLFPAHVQSGEARSFQTLLDSGVGRAGPIKMLALRKDLATIPVSVTISRSVYRGAPSLVLLVRCAVLSEERRPASPATAPASAPVSRVTSVPQTAPTMPATAPTPALKTKPAADTLPVSPSVAEARLQPTKTDVPSAPMTQPQPQVPSTSPGQIPAVQKQTAPAPSESQLMLAKMEERIAAQQAENRELMKDLDIARKEFAAKMEESARLLGNALAANADLQKQVESLCQRLADKEAAAQGRIAEKEQTPVSAPADLSSGPARRSPVAPAQSSLESDLRKVVAVALSLSTELKARHGELHTVKADHKRLQIIESVLCRRVDELEQQQAELERRAKGTAEMTSTERVLAEAEAALSSLANL